MASTPAAQVRNEARYWLYRLAVPASYTYRTWTRLPRSGRRRAQATPFGPTPAVGVRPVPPPGASAGASSAGALAPASASTSRSRGAARMSRRGSVAAGAVRADRRHGALDVQPGRRLVRTVRAQVRGSASSYAPTHGAPFFAGSRPW